MRRLRASWIRLLNHFGFDKLDAEFNEELDAHLAMHIEDNVRAGMSPMEARRAALIKLGGVEATKEAHRARRSIPLFEALQGDLRFAVRGFQKSPGIALLAIAIFTLSIGASTALFSVINAVLLRPLPFPNPDRLVMLWESDPKHSVDTNQVAPANFFNWRSQSKSFDSMGAVASRDMILTGNGDTLQLRGFGASAEIFSTLGIQPQLGRTFDGAEDWPVRAHVMLISHSLWMERFAGDSNIIGRALTLDGYKYTVIGVMPRGFVFLNKRIEFWTPLGFNPKAFWDEGRYLRVAARLKADASPTAAQAELHSLSITMAKRAPAMQTGWDAVVRPLRDEYVRKSRLPLIALAAAISCIVLIGCANIGGLLLARGATRMRETAVRVSLGASGGRIISQHLCEALLLTGAGGLMGSVAARFGSAMLVRNVPEAVDITSMGPIAFNWQVWAFAAISVLGTGVICAVAPALAAVRQDPQSILRGGGHSAGQRQGVRIRRFFVVLQTAIAILLLSGAGLLLRSLLHLYSAPVGFEPENVLSFDVDLPDSTYPKPDNARKFYARALERLRALPGVKSAALVDNVPLGGLGVGTYFYIGGQPDSSPGSQPVAQMRAITPDYFRTLDIPLHSGRDFTDRDDSTAPRAYIINELLARRFFPNQNPIGRPISIMWASREPGVIVGVVGDVRYTGIENEVMPTIYWSEWQHTFGSMNFLLKSNLPPLSLSGAVAREMKSIDSQVPLNHVQPLAAFRERQTATAKFMTSLLAGLALLAIVLAASGLFGLLAYLVTQQRRDIGIRIALGAYPRQILAAVTKEGGTLIVLGMVIGIGLSLAAGRAMSSLLFEVQVSDWQTFVPVITILLFAAAIAIAIPARRAALVDPSIVLRQD